MSKGSHTATEAPLGEVGFSVKQGADWSQYLQFRPEYPASFFQRIYNYHSRKSPASWQVAHDNGAGCGIVSAALALRFSNVIVSDPNEGYAKLARKALVDESGIPEARLRFLQEGAERSSVQSHTVDLVTACECIHWTNTEAALNEFHRLLKAGGTAAITHYTMPRIVDNERADTAWKAIYAAYADRARSELLNHAFKIINTGLDCLDFAEEKWESVERVYINASGDIRSFATNDRVGPSAVKESEAQTWVEDDKDWIDEKDLSWLKGYIGTWVPVLPESEVQGLWQELDTAMGGQKVTIETPVAMVFATKKA